MPIPRLLTVTFQHMDSDKTLSVELVVADACRYTPAKMGRDRLEQDGFDTSGYVYLKHESRPLPVD